MGAPYSALYRAAAFVKCPLSACAEPLVQVEVENSNLKL